MIHNISRFIAALALLATAQGAWADTETVSYIDADGTEKTVTATVLTGDAAADGLSTNAYGQILIPAGWYVVKNSKDGVDASYTAQLRYSDANGTGNINLILADGAEMTVNKSTTHAIYLDYNYPLAIYGQSAGTGRLTVTGNSKAIEAYQGITINGGIVSVTDTDTGSNSYAIYVMNGITINGGQLTATTAGSGKGIYCYSGAITIGCRKASDFVSFNSYYGTVNIKSGQTLYAGATAYSGDDVSLPSGAVTLRPYSSDDFSVSGDEYTIHTATGWNLFCDFLQDNDSWNRFSGKTVRLGANITVTRMAGSSGHDFCGTFDGGGYTLDVNISSDDDHDYTAPFSYISNTKANPGDEANSPAAIRNLNVTGTVTATKDLVSGLVGAFWGTLTIEDCTVSASISTNNKHAAGFISREQGNATIRNCRSSVNISGTVSGDGTHAGFIGGSGSGVTTAIEGCLFDGSLLGTATTHCAGFVGYNSGTLTISNSLFDPADVSVGDDNSCTFARNGGTVTVENCYYTAALGTAQGKATRTVTADADVTIDAVALTGTATQYTVSGITAYSGGGLQRGQTLYYGSGDQLSLTLSNSATPAPQGYQYAYTASAGTLSGSTLTMPDDDVTISTALAPIDWATVNEGDSEDDPYMIYNKDQLLLLAHRVNGTSGETANDYKGKYFKLGADITFTHAANEGDDYAENYEAIGGYLGGYTYRHFRGNFNGDNKTVSGIRIRKTGDGDADSYQGLFGMISGGGTIHDVHLTDARIKSYYYVGGIVGYNNSCTVSGCTVTDSYITATKEPTNNYGTICGYTNYTDRLTNNYYHGCTVNGTAVTSGKGCQGADLTANHGALPAYRLALGANITTPPGTFAGQTGWLDTPPVSPRLAPENGFTLAGNHYFASGYVFTPGSTLASGAAQGYTPRATLGGQLLDLYTPTGDAPDYTGTAIARLTISADCEGKTLAAALRSTGQPVTVAYIKADGTPDETSAIALDGTETTLAAGWYFVGKDISYTQTLTLSGDVTLILKDGCEMNVGESGSEVDGYGIICYDEANNTYYDLTICGQTAQTGTLSVYTTGQYHYAIGTRHITVNGGNVIAHTDGSGCGIDTKRSGNVTINRGSVSATTTYTGIFAWAISAAGNLTINGGNVSAKSNSHAILADGNVAINGGTVNATGGDGGYSGIYSNGTIEINGGNVTASSIYSNGTAITLGWTRPADRITASSISTGEGGTVAVADGKALTDGSGNIYTGTLTAADLATLADKTTLQPCLALADAADNTAAIADHAGKTLAVALSGRTLYKDGSWNTLCLPFSVSTASGTLSDDGVKAMTLNTTTSSLADGTLTLNFDDAKGQTIPAGTPFIIKWNNTGVNIENPVFEDVTVSKATNDATVDGVLTFTGTYAPVKIADGGDNTKLYLGSGNKLYYPNAAMTIGCQRAYFQLLGDLTAGKPAGEIEQGKDQEDPVRAFVLNFGDDEANGILSVSAESSREALPAAWYTLDGRRLDGQPTAKGLYIHGGKKVIVK